MVMNKRKDCRFTYPVAETTARRQTYSFYFFFSFFPLPWAPCLDVASVVFYVSDPDHSPQGSGELEWAASWHTIDNPR